MRIFTGLCAVSSLLFSTASVWAAGPDGKYAFVQTEMCEAKISIVKDGLGNVRDVNLSESGMMSGAVGYITFTPTSATGGNAKITGSTIIEGGALRVDSNGFNWLQQANNQGSTAYSFTTTTFTFGGQSFKMTTGDVVSGVARSVYLVSLDTSGGNANCVQIISATKQ